MTLASAYAAALYISVAGASQVNVIDRHVKLYVTLLSVFAAAFSTAAEAIIPLCGLLGQTIFLPAHPQAKDQLTFNIDIFNLAAANLPVLSKITYGPGNAVSFDVVLVPPNAIAMFPGYQTDPVTAQEAIGTLGPLPAGQYSVTTSVREYDPASGFVKFCDDRNTTLIVYADDGLSPVIEYYNSKLDHYFITQYPDEIVALDAGVISGWTRTGQSFLAYRPNQGAGQQVVRYYGLPSAGLDSHFLTSNFADIFLLVTPPFNADWVAETGDAFDLNEPIKFGLGIGTCMPGEVPLYRLWNRRKDSDHRHTTDPAIKAQMIAKGYVAEGYGPDAVMNCAFTR